MSESPPSKLYKYRSLDSSSAWNTIKTIIDNTIYFSSPSSFNDIFDCSPVLTCSSTDESLKDEYILRGRVQFPRASEHQLQAMAEKIIGDPKRDIRLPDVLLEMQEGLRDRLAKMGVYCLSESNDDILMWAHYADNHKGICLEFSTDDKRMQMARRVEYSTERPVVDQLNEDYKTSAKKALLTKSKHWAYEKEWRIFAGKAFVGSVEIEPSTLTGIIFGAMTSESDIQAIKKLVQLRASPVRLYSARKNNSKFELDIVAE